MCVQVCVCNNKTIYHSKKGKDFYKTDLILLLLLPIPFSYSVEEMVMENNGNLVSSFLSFFFKSFKNKNKTFVTFNIWALSEIIPE